VRRLLVVVLAAALAGAGTAPALAATERVRIGDNYFVRDDETPTVTVAKNTRVKWVWRGDSAHNVKVASGPVTFGSSTKRSGSYAKKVRRKGTYRIVCTVHGAYDQSMKLVVR
jgi:plastocyanin